MSNKQYTGEKQGFFFDYVILPIKRYIGLVNKEMKTLFNDKVMMLITYAIPITIILILTMGFSTEWLSDEEGGSGGITIDQDSIDVGEFPPKIGIIDRDNSEGFPDVDLSKEFISYFERYELAGKCILVKNNNQTELEYMLGVGDINAVIIIEPLFEFNLSIHLPVIVPFIIDAINFDMLQTTQVVVNTVINEFRNDYGFLGVFETEQFNVNVPKGRAQTYFAAAPYFIPLLLFGIGALISTQSIVSDIPKDRMVLTPTNKFEMMAAKVTGNFLVMTTVVLLILITSMVVELDIKSSWFVFFIVMEICVFNAVLFGVSISAISKTSLAAFQFFIFIYLFMAISVLFIGDEMILMWIPLYNGGALVMNVVLRGQILWTVRGEIMSIVIESIILYLTAYIVFKRQKTML